ncbi:MAG: PilW family protein, partial [Gemmatimonadales bacterium]
MQERGFTLIEVMIGMVVLAILGTALTQMLLSDSRFVNRQEAMLDARQAARAAMNIMTVELRLVG